MRNHCAGCYNDFYNHREGDGECWSLKTAQVVTRYRIGWWITPDTPGAFTKVKTYQCHHEPGRYAFQESAPDFAVDVREETP